MNNRATGFTLIEMLVSVALFAIVMLMVASAYLIIVGSDQQAQAVASGSNDLGFAVDTMAREIRTGTGYSCGAGGNCFPTPGTSFSFTDATGDSVVYSLNSGEIVETINGQSYPLTDKSITISSLAFYAQGIGTNSYLQPQVLISISGTVSSGNGKSLPFTIETGATMRALNL